MFEIASSDTFQKATIWDASPHGRLFAGFLAVFYLLSDFWAETLRLMIFHQNDSKMISKIRMIARSGILAHIGFWRVP